MTQRVDGIRFYQTKLKIKGFMDGTTDGFFERLKINKENASDFIKKLEEDGVISKSIEGVVYSLLNPGQIHLFNYEDGVNGYYSDTVDGDMFYISCFMKKGSTTEDFIKCFTENTFILFSEIERIENINRDGKHYQLFKKFLKVAQKAINSRTILSPYTTYMDHMHMEYISSM